VKAFQVINFDTKPTLVNTPIPEPGSKQVLVKISACGLNFADLLMVKGTYQDLPPLPFTLGMEVAGEVVALGHDVKKPVIGTRVAVFGGNGGLAEYGSFSADLCVELPPNMSFEDASAFQVAYSTSHVALDYRAKLKPGENLLVLGAAGGVGLTAVELGKILGAKVIAAARGPEKLAVAQKAGADHLIDTDKENLKDVVKNLGGADVVYDPIGGELFKSALRASNPEARILTIGFASGEVPQIAANHLLVKNLNIIGFYWGGYLKFKPTVISDSTSQLFEWYSSGIIKPHISYRLPLDEAHQGLELLRTRKSTGKVIIQTDPNLS
jgi:NADPH2:quinone reductase